MRGNSDLSETYPFSVAPANGWGNPNPTGEQIIINSAHLGKGVKLGDNIDFAVPYSEATRFKDAVDAAIASGDVAKAYRETCKKLAAA